MSRFWCSLEPIDEVRSSRVAEVADRVHEIVTTHVGPWTTVLDDARLFLSYVSKPLPSGFRF
jgi:hypothetical protein